MFIGVFAGNYLHGSPCQPAPCEPCGPTDTEEGRLQHLYTLYGKFFKQADLMKKIVFGLADQNRRTNFRHAYAAHGCPWPTQSDSSVPGCPPPHC